MRGAFGADITLPAREEYLSLTELLQRTFETPIAQI